MASKDLLNSGFHEFGKAVAPTAEQVNEYNGIVDRLSKLLQRKSTYRLDRIRPAGSFFKRTGIGAKMDLDIVFYLNDQSPPFEKVLSHFEDIILLNYELEEDDIHKSPFSLQFSLKSGSNEIEIDLVAAKNFVFGHELGPNESEVCELQHRRALHAIRNAADPIEVRKFYSGSLTEAAIEFVKQQSASIHELVRLAKFWVKSMYFERKISGLSSTIEMIAIFVGMEMERDFGRPFSLTAAVERFLKTMQGIRSEKIVFSQENMQRFHCKTFYTNKDIPKDMVQQSPLILDPADPFNNRLRGCRDDFFQLISGKAKDSLEALQKVSSMSGTGNVLLAIMNILVPGPFNFANFPSVGRATPLTVPRNVAIRTRGCPSVSKPTLTSRTNDQPRKKHAEFIMNLYDLIVRSAKAITHTTQMPSMRTETAGKISEKVLENALKQTFHPVAAIDENAYDFTLKIPLDSGNVQEIFFKW